MLEIYRLLRSGNIEIGELHNNDGTLSIYLKKGLDLLQYPALFHGEVEKGNFYIADDRVRYWISTRIFPPERMDRRDILKDLGLEKYDPWLIFLKIKGSSMRDNITIERV